MVVDQHSQTWLQQALHSQEPLEQHTFLKEFGFALLDKSKLQCQKLLLMLLFLLLHLFLLYQQVFQLLAQLLLVLLLELLLPFLR